MNKFLTLLFACLFPVVVFAQSITVIVNGKPGGTFYQRSELYVQGLETLGYKVNTVDATTRQSKELFENMQDPVLMVWIDSLMPIVDLNVSSDNFVSSEYTSAMYFCTRPESDNKTVAFPKVYTLEPVKELGDYKFIPYKNSGAAVNALIAKEVDHAYINQKGASKLSEFGNTCDVIDGIQQTAFVVARNIEIPQIKQDIKKIQQSAEFINWLNNIDVEYVDLDFDAVQNSINIWQGR